MARKIIILENRKAMKPQIRACFWLDVPAEDQANFALHQEGVSQFAGATQAELDAINSGLVAERVEVHSFENGTTVAQIKAALVSRYNDLQAKVNANRLYDYYGAYWDGSTWTNP